MDAITSLGNFSFDKVTWPSDVKQQLWEPIVGDESIVAAARAHDIVPIPESSTTTYWVALDATVIMISTQHEGYVDFRNNRGALHNPYGPARLIDGGSRSHYFDGKLHWTKGPAVVTADAGPYEFWEFGVRTNRLGAAIACDGWGEWWVDGVWCDPLVDIADVTKLSAAELLAIPPYIPKDLRIPGVDVMSYDFEE